MPTCSIHQNNAHRNTKKTPMLPRGKIERGKQFFIFALEGYNDLKVRQVNNRFNFYVISIYQLHIQRD